MTSNYFTRLVDRAFERGAVLQRRQPSRFESRSEATVRLDASDDAREQNAAPNAEPRSATHPQDVTATHTSRVVSLAREDSADRHTRDERNDRDLVPTVVPAPDTRDGDTPTHTASISPAPALQPLASTRSIEHVVVTREIERTRLVGADTARSTDLRAETTPMRVEILETVTPPPVEQPVVAAAGRRPSRRADAREDSPGPRATVSPDDRSVSRRVAATPRIDRVPRDRPIAGAAVPTVHVTIGRIEVHAAKSSEPSARTSRRAEPMLSLDRYLRSRSGEHT